MRRELAAAVLAAALAACRAPSTNAPPPPAPMPPRAAPAPAAPAAPAPRAPATGSSAAAARAAAPPSTQEGLSAWKKNHEGLDAGTPVKDCLGCHEGTHIAVHSSHTFDADYASAAGLPGSSLRAPAEAQQRGARLPGGKLHCLSCHDPGSPWKSHVALPAGARVRAALVLGPDDGSGEASEQAQAKAQAAPASGSAVNTMPLCQTCHTYGD
jgi:hypothetical protein